MNLINEQRSRIDSGSYTRIQFLQAASYSAHCRSEAAPKRVLQRRRWRRRPTCRRPPAAATGTTTSTSAATPAAAADNCCEVWCVWSGNEMASHLSRAATLVSVPLVSTESSVWAPAARFVALISRWWRASVTKHCSYYNECSFFKWHWLPLSLCLWFFYFVITFTWRKT